MSALGRFLITKKEADIASFKTPNLRNVLVTGPYFHDGSQETLWDVIDHYNKGDGLKNPCLDEDIQPLALTEGEIDDLVAFLASLTSADYKEQGVKEVGASARPSPGRIGPSATRREPSARSRPSPNRPAIDPDRRSTATTYGRHLSRAGVTPPRTVTNHSARPAKNRTGKADADKKILAMTSVPKHRSAEINSEANAFFIASM